MSEKKKYYANVKITYEADRVFDTSDERDEYLANVSRHILQDTNPLYDTVYTNISKGIDGPYRPLRWNRGSNYTYSYARTEDDE